MSYHLGIPIAPSTGMAAGAVAEALLDATRPSPSPPAASLAPSWFKPVAVVVGGLLLWKYVRAS